MTALAGRRRRSTIVASIAALAAVAVVVTLTTVGALTLYHSTDGAEASSRRAELVFPSTPVAAIAALDGGGKLASLAVLVVQPAGRGGSIIPIPVSADSSGGAGAERLPLDETLAVGGQQGLRDELAVLLRLGFEDVAFVDAAELSELLAPLGTLTVDLPVDVTDADGTRVAAAGETPMEAADAAAVLAARDPDVPATTRYRAAGAVWAAVAAAAGGDTTSGPPPSAPSTGTAPAGSSVARLFGELIAGRVGERTLRTSPVPDDQNPRGVDVTLLDPAEVLLVFGQIAPGAVSAPGSGLSFRVVSAFSDEQLAGTGLTNTDVAHRAIARILAAGGNVVSVATSGEAPDAATVLAVSDATMVAGAQQDETQFGTVEVVVDEQPIAGVDVVATLGTDALRSLAAETAGSGGG